MQTERGHIVSNGGPYRFVRHPGYVGAIAADLATPFLLGSLWALIPSVLLAGLFVLRTALEDQTLTAELPGYEAYAAETRSFAAGRLVKTENVSDRKRDNRKRVEDDS